VSRRVVAADDFDAALRGPFCWGGQFEAAAGSRRKGNGRRTDGDERAQEYRAVVILSADCRRAVRMRECSVAIPVTVDSSTLVMVRGVIVGMRVDERARQGGALDGQRKRDGNHLSHGERPLFVAARHRVKATAQGPAALVIRNRCGRGRCRTVQRGPQVQPLPQLQVSPH
jgi:hypothetical protein